MRVLLLASTRRTSLVAHMVNNLPAVQEAWVQTLGREDPLEKEMETTPDRVRALPCRCPLPSCFTLCSSLSISTHCRELASAFKGLGKIVSDSTHALYKLYHSLET